MTYPVIGAPPSLSGFCHLRSAWSLSQSTSSKDLGLDGSSGSLLISTNPQIIQANLIRINSMIAYPMDL